MTYIENLNSAAESLEKAQTEFDPEKLGIPQGSNREAAMRSSLGLAVDILGLIQGD